MPARANRLSVAHNSRAACALQLVGTLSNDDDDNNNNVKKQLVLWAKQQLCTCITLFSTFLWRPLHDYDMKPPECDVLWRTWTYDDRLSLLYFNMDNALKNSTLGKVANIWRIERFQVDAIKFERTQIHFFSNVFHCRRRRCLRSLIMSTSTCLLVVMLDETKRA